MTYRGRVAIEHPEAVNRYAIGGVIGCPSAYNYENERKCSPLGEKECANCWNRNAPPRKVKPRRKEHEKANG